MPSASASENSGSNRTYSWRVTPRIYRSVLFHALEVEVEEGRRPVGELLHRFRHGGGLGELVVLHRRLVRRELDDGHELPCVVAVPAHHCPRRRALACSLLTELVDDLLHVVELRRLVLDDLHETCHVCLLSSIGWWAASMRTSYPDASSAWRRSATRSSALSMPTESRTSEESTASGEPAADACCTNAIRSASSASCSATTPPTTSEWPPRYFVLECTTTSAPRPSGCCRYGVAKVLSTTTRAPRSCASLATAAMSTTVSSGFVGVSTHTSFVSSRQAPVIASRSAWSTAVQAIPAGSYRRATSRYVPPYASAGMITWSPASSAARRVASSAAMPLANASPCSAPSSSATHVSRAARVGLALRAYSYPRWS